MKRSVAAGPHGTINGVRCKTKPDALIGSTAAAKHRKARRGTTGGDHVLGVALGPGRVDLDVVASTGRDVLDVQRSHHRTSPFGIGVSADFRRSRRSCACKTRGTGGDRPAALL